MQEKETWPDGVVMPFGAVWCALALLAAAPPALGAPAASAGQGAAVPGVAEPALELARDWVSGSSPAAYLVSEKFDGVRAYWDGKILRFRSGRPIAAPAWFVAALPAQPLDGELWLERQSFERLSGIARKEEPLDEEWREVRYLVFDLPNAPGGFAQRAARIPAVVASTKAPWLQAVEQVRLPDAKTLQAHLLKVSKAGGEGLMLHRADAIWKPGRSDALRKLKREPDEDAKVVGILPGKGKHEGRMGALLLELPNRQRFALGTGFTDAQREHPPRIGSTVTYRYRDRTSTGLPRFASFLRERQRE